MARPAVVTLLVLFVVLAAAGCGAGAKENGEVTIMVSSRGYPEEEVLREIYAHALERAGFRVLRRPLKGRLAIEELEEGGISGYPDHLETALTEGFPAEPRYISNSTEAAYREAQKQLASKGFVPFPPTSFERSKAVGLLKQTAEEYRVETLSDLKADSRKMNVTARELYCHGPAFCLAGLEESYGIVFETFSGISLGKPSMVLYKALREGKADAVMLVTTDGELARRKDWLTLLEDDRNRLPAANAFWMTSEDVVDEAGPDYERAILAAQRSLTLKAIRELDAEVELEGKPPREVAAEYLKRSTGGGAR
jgi:osmoprotectant transport system substrate-binding protein